MIKNVLKLVFLGVVGFSFLIYLTAEKPTQLSANRAIQGPLTLQKLPNSFELVGKVGEITKEVLFPKESKTLIVVGNHDSLAVVKELPKYHALSINYVMVANISSAPWFVKKMFIPSKLEELNKESNIPMIYDFDGDTVAALGVTNNTKTAYTAFIVNSDGTISKLLEGNVKEGALDGSMNEAEKKEALKPLIEML